MQKRHINAKEIVKDVRSGRTDADLMEKYRLSPKGLESLFLEMLEAGLIEPADLQGRWSSYSHKVELEDNRKATRSSVNVLVSVHDVSNPALKGIVLDISERGLMAKHLQAAANEVKTLVIGGDPEHVTASIEFDAVCRWARQEQDGEPVGGFEITSISDTNLAALRSLIRSLPALPGNQRGFDTIYYDGESTQTVDLSSVFAEEVTSTGSFTFKGIERTWFGKLLQALPMSALLIDQAFRITFLNKNFEKVSPEYKEIEGRPFARLFPEPAAAQQAKAVAEQVFSTRKRQSTEATLKIGQGSIWCRMHFQSIRIGPERAILILIEDLTHEKEQLSQSRRLREELERRIRERTVELVMRNDQLTREILERKQVESALRESEGRYRLFLKNFKGIAYRTGPDFAPIFFHGAVEMISGYSEEDLIAGQPNWDEIIHPDDLSEIRRSALDVGATSNYSAQREYRIYRKDGEIRWVRDHVQSICDDAETPASFQGIIYDITNQKRLQEERDRLFNLSMDMLCVVGFDGYFRQVNPACEKTLGWARGEILARPALDFVHPDDRRKTIEAGEQLVVGKPVRHFEARHRCKDGSYRWLSWDSFPVTDEKLVYAVVRDITELKCLEEQLRQAAKMEAIGRLAGGIAHDFNNLMTAVTGYSSMLLQQMPDRSAHREKVLRIYRAAERAAGLTKQLLAFSRKQVLDVKLLNLNEVIADFGEMLRRFIGESTELVTVFDPSLRNVQADPGQMEQILINLAVNARDAMPNGGVLKIETADVYLDDEYCRIHGDVEPGHYAMLTVSDNGVGMDAEVLSCIFDPFFTTKEKGVGTGLGLASVYGIVKQHRGHIAVHSERGRGTTFKLYLPPAEESSGQVFKPSVSQAQVGGTETVLVVEDEEIVRDLACQSLEALGYRPLVASHPAQAIAVSDTHNGPIHLLLSDVVLPQMDGKTMYDALARKRPEMKVLYMSGYTDSFIVDRGILSPGVHFVRKPFSVEVLAAKVREVLDG